MENNVYYELTEDIISRNNTHKITKGTILTKNQWRDFELSVSDKIFKLVKKEPIFEIVEWNIRSIYSIGVVVKRKDGTIEELSIPEFESEINKQLKQT